MAEKKYTLKQSDVVQVTPKNISKNILMYKQMKQQKSPTPKPSSYKSFPHRDSRYERFQENQYQEESFSNKYSKEQLDNRSRSNRFVPKKDQTNKLSSNHNTKLTRHQVSIQQSKKQIQYSIQNSENSWNQYDETWINYINSTLDLTPSQLLQFQQQAKYLNQWLNTNSIILKSQMDKSMLAFKRCLEQDNKKMCNLVDDKLDGIMDYIDDRQGFVRQAKKVYKEVKKEFGIYWGVEDKEEEEEEGEKWVRKNGDSI